jgi:hypothetical protein
MEFNADFSMATADTGGEKETVCCDAGEAREDER